MSKRIDLKGKKYNRWTVLNFSKVKNKRGYWICQCDCGNIREVNTSALINGSSKSCGCLHNENVKRTMNGLSKTKLYRNYSNIKQRCFNSKFPLYKNYGGRGIIMCDEWKNDFMSFYNWAMSNGYKENLTIDRIDVNGNYEPNNCRWITMKEQYHNRTDNVYYIVNKNKKCLAELCEEYNMPYQTVRKRLERGENIINALTKPISKKYRNKLCKMKGE